MYVADHQRSRVARFETSYPLTPGTVYPVVGITIAETTLCFLVPDDWGDPCFAPAGMFELFSDVIPPGWKFSLDAGISSSGPALWGEPSVATWGYPELVDDPDYEYAKRLLEREPDAIRTFQAQVAASLEAGY